MRNPDHNPYDSALPSLFQEYPATSRAGRNVRRADAQLRLKQMTAAEETIQRQEELNAQIGDRIARQIAESQLRLQYLVEFGVTSAEREQFRLILEQVAQHGGLSLREAANLAHAKSNSDESSDDGY